MELFPKIFKKISQKAPLSIITDVQVLNVALTYLKASASSKTINK